MGGRQDELSVSHRRTKPTAALLGPDFRRAAAAVAGICPEIRAPLLHRAEQLEGAPPTAAACAWLAAQGDELAELADGVRSPTASGMFLAARR